MCSSKRECVCLQASKSYLGLHYNLNKKQCLKCFNVMLWPFCWTVDFCIRGRSRVWLTPAHWLQGVIGAWLASLSADWTVGVPPVAALAECELVYAVVLHILVAVVLKVTALIIFHLLHFKNKPTFLSPLIVFSHPPLSPSLSHSLPPSLSLFCCYIWCMTISAS